MKPMLFPNNVTTITANVKSGGLDMLSLPSMSYLMSIKRDGVLGIIHKGELFNRSMEKFNNEFLDDMFADILLISEQRELTFIGEIYKEGMDFNAISGVCRSKNKLPYGFEFFCFDMIVKENYNEGFYYRYTRYLNEVSADNFVPVVHTLCSSPSEMIDFFNKCVNSGYEGAVVRSPMGCYLQRRLELKDNVGFKMKDIFTEDTQILYVEEEHKNTGKSFKTKTGSKKRKLKKNMISSGLAGALVVDYNGKIQKVGLSSLTNEEKAEIWSNKEKYIGKWIEYKGMHSSKGKVRHPTFYRWRTDLDARD